MSNPITAARSLSEQAYDYIREAIISLQLTPGQTIQENELGVSLGISRTPIRDACHLLVSEQLIEIMPQRTKKIAAISVSKVLESNVVRLSLECTAFRLAAKHWDPDPHSIYTQTEKRMRQLLEEQQEAATSQKAARFLQLDEEFHRLVLQLSGNQTLIDVVAHMRGHLNRFRLLAMRELVLTKGLVNEHEQLLEAMIHQDEGKVTLLLEQHLGKINDEIVPLRTKFPHYFKD